MLGEDTRVAESWPMYATGEPPPMEEELRLAIDYIHFLRQQRQRARRQAKKSRVE